MRKRICLSLAALCINFLPAHADQSPEAKTIRKCGFESGKPKYMELRGSLYTGESSTIPAKEKVKIEIQDKMSFSGKKAACFTMLDDKALSSVIFYMMEITPGMKYRFKGHYFLKSDAPGKNRISGRVTFYSEDKKLIRHIFPGTQLKSDAWTAFEFEFYPPLKTKYISLTLWCSGKGSIYWDDLSIASANEEQVKNDYNFDVLAADCKDFKIWKKYPNEKIPRTGVPGNLKKTGINISCAKNESEPFILVFTPEKDFDNVSIEFSDLKNKNGKIIGSSNISYRPIDFIYIKESSNPSLTGWNSDPLLNSATHNCKAGMNNPFWIEIKTPKGAAPGAYNGFLTLKSKGKKISKLGYQLNVRDFSIPDIPKLKSAFYTRSFINQMGQFDKRPQEEIDKDIFENLKKHRITGNQGYTPPLPKWSVSDGNLTINDWSEFDNYVEGMIQNYNIRWFKIPQMGFFGDNDGWYRWWKDKNKFFGAKINSPLGLKYMTQYSKQLYEHLKEKGWEKYFFAYVWDEPAKEEAIEAVNKLISAIKKGAPINIFLTSSANRKIPNVNLWCVPFAPGHVDIQAQAERLRNGNAVWYYNWNSQLGKAEYIRNRLYPWLAYMNDGSGVLLWAVLFTRKGVNPWTDMDKTYENGAVTLMYPGKNGKGKYVDSMRFALMKEGIDDFDYMKALEEKINSRFPGKGKKRVKEILSGLITKTPFQYKNDPSLLYKLRDKLADEIEDFDKEPVFIIESSPQENSSTSISRATIAGICPPGSQVKIGRENIKVPEDGKFVCNVDLSRKGENIIEISVSKDGKEKRTSRRFIRVDDSALEDLNKAIAKAEKDGLKTEYFEKMEAKLRNSAQYTESHKKLARKTLEDLTEKLLDNLFSKEKSNAKNPLYRALFERAKWARKNNLPLKAEQYIRTALKMNPEQDLSGSTLQITPCRYKDHFAFKVKNSLIEALILESGARIFDFKAKGVSCLKQGDLSKDYPELTRTNLGRHSTDLKLPNLGGYEDAGMVQTASSFFDWNISFPEISEDKITIAGETLLPDKKYLLRREMTFKKNDPRVQLKYIVKNVLPTDFISDDPASYQFHWRAHLAPAIGGNPDNDIIVAPSKEKLPQNTFRSNQKTFYEKFSIPLSDSYLGSYDPKEKTAFVQILDPAVKHAYVWFDSSSKGNIYTLEPHRTFLGHRSNEDNGAKPFDIKPGETLVFTNYLAGLSDIKNEEDFKSKTEKMKEKPF